MVALLLAGCGGSPSTSAVPGDGTAPPPEDSRGIIEPPPGGGGNEEPPPGGDGGEKPVTFLSPSTDPAFAKLPDGRALSSISVSGSGLSLSKGSGGSWTAAKNAEYMQLKAASQTDPAHKVHWVFADLDDRKVIAKSLSSHKRLFGASSSKMYVAATLLDKQNGQLSASQLQLMAEMLSVSSNTAWTNLQTQIGDGSSDKGRERNYAFTQRMGYKETRGFQGSWGSMHGNELVADETIEFLYDMYTGGFPGAELLWKMIHACRTGASRGRKYIPSSIYVGGKTGTYDGSTENPETGGTYSVAIRNHALVFNIGGKQYALVVLANSGSDESAALLAGGLVREYAGVK